MRSDEQKGEQRRASSAGERETEAGLQEAKTSSTLISPFQNTTTARSKPTTNSAKGPAPNLVRRAPRFSPALIHNSTCINYSASFQAMNNSTSPPGNSKKSPNKNMPPSN